MKIAVYPGTFDPITYGHIDVIKKSLKIFDRIIVATTNNTDKNYFFSIEERVDIINNSLFKDLKLEKKKIKIISFSDLTINLCRKYNAKEFSIEDLERMVEACNKLKDKCSILISNFSVDLVKDYFKKKDGWNFKETEKTTFISGKAKGRTKVKEAIIYNSL